MPPPLSAVRLERLQRAIVDAFPTLMDLVALARLALDESLDVITLAPNLAQRALDLLVWARDRGCLDVLLTTARTERPDHVLLAAEARAIDGLAPPTHPTADLALVLYRARRAVPVVGVSVSLRDVFSGDVFDGTTDDAGIARLTVERPRTLRCELAVGASRHVALPLISASPLPYASEVDLATIPDAEWTDAATAPPEVVRAPPPSSPKNLDNPAFALRSGSSAAKAGDPRFEGGATLLLRPPSRSPHLRWGRPAAPVVFEREAYVLGFDPALKLARWIAYQVTATGPRPRPIGRFIPDPEIAVDVQIPASAYRGSPYDRGSLARRLELPVSAERDIFLLSLCVPQHRSVNQRVWSSIEDLSTRAVRDAVVWVIAGTIVTGWAGDPHAVLGLADRYTIPAWFFRVMVRERAGVPPEVLAFLVPNTQDADDDPRVYRCTAREVCEAAGLELFDGVVDPAERERLLDDAKGPWWG